MIKGIRIDYAGGADAGTDVTITEPSGLKRTIVNVENNATPKNVYPVIAATDTAGGNISGHYYQCIGVDSSNLLISVAQAGAALAPAATITIQLVEDF